MSDHTRVHVDAVLASFVTPYAPAPVPGGFMSCDYDVTEEKKYGFKKPFAVLYDCCPRAWAVLGTVSVSQVDARWPLCALSPSVVNVQNTVYTRG